MSPRPKAACVLILAVSVIQIIASANALPVPTPSSRSARTPAEKAVEAYNHGIDARNRALTAEEQARRISTAADRVFNEETAREELERALELFEQAATFDPGLPQAWNAIGFVHRKLGNYELSLGAYDRALALAPNFPDALEYRGETFLALNRIADAKEAYLAVFALDRKQAEILLKAMSAWIAERKAQPAGTQPSVLADLETWINERTGLAQQTRLMGYDAVYTSW